MKLAGAATIPGVIAVSDAGIVNVGGEHGAPMWRGIDPACDDSGRILLSGSKIFQDCLPPVAGRGCPVPDRPAIWRHMIEKIPIRHVIRMTLGGAIEVFVQFQWLQAMPGTKLVDQFQNIAAPACADRGVLAPPGL